MRGLAVDHSVKRRYFALNFIALMTNLKIWPGVLILTVVCPQSVKLQHLLCATRDRLKTHTVTHILIKLVLCQYCCVYDN